MYEACLLLGSNINPLENIRAAVRELRKVMTLQKLSQVWETKAEGSPGPRFLNLAALATTELEALSLKGQVLRPIEKMLGRVRTGDKSAPRIIDLDIIVFNGIVIEKKLWESVFMALPISELLPQLINPHTNQSLIDFAQQIERSSTALSCPDLYFDITN
jgi:2-amino-4-hydroxy-6-hydroxymethyldihydropteridine diphosphokinase